MLYLFFGEDTYRSRQALREFIEAASKDKGRPFSVSWLSADTFSRANFEEYERTENLFGGKYLVVCEGLLKEAETADFVTKNLKLCSRSENVFLFWEEELEPSFLKNFKNHAKKIEEFKPFSSAKTRNWLEGELKKRKVVMAGDLSEELIRQYGSDLWSLSQALEKHSLAPKVDLFLNRKAGQVNIFHIADAVAEKDRSRAWFLFQKALLSGIDPEEIFWKITWQIKNLLLLKKIGPLPEKKIIEATRLHPYVVKKTLSACRNYSEKELAGYSSELIDLYHNARRGLAEFDVGIEKFLIKI
jgi:DNA polymerase III delta subunit